VLYTRLLPAGEAEANKKCANESIIIIRAGQRLKFLIAINLMIKKTLLQA